MSLGRKKMQHQQAPAISAGLHLLAAASNRHEKRATHMKHLARGLKLRAGDFDTLWQKGENKRGTAR
jgi:hypothetical protein